MDPSLMNHQLMEAVVARQNMLAAIQRLRQNGGAAGIDKMSVQALTVYLKTEWPQLKERLLVRQLRASSGQAGRHTQTW